MQPSDTGDQMNGYEIIPTRIFSEMPKEFLKYEETKFSRDMTIDGRPVPSFLEGPSFDRDGNLYVVDVAHGRIFRIATDGEWTLVADYPGRPNGLKVHQDGRIFVADRDLGLVEIDPVNGKVSPYVPAERLSNYKGLNDLFFSSNGDLYFTDQGETGLHDPTGQLWKLDTKGNLTCLLNNIPSPNGLVMDPEETLLYLAVTRMNAVWRVPIRPDGSVHRVGMFCQLEGGTGPDGMAMDVDGNLSIAHIWRGAVWLYSPLGLPLVRLDGWGDTLAVTNLAYGGVDNRSLFITNSMANNILVAELPVSGRLMYGQM